MREGDTFPIRAIDYCTRAFPPLIVGVSIASVLLSRHRVITAALAAAFIGANFALNYAFVGPIDKEVSAAGKWRIELIRHIVVIPFLFALTWQSGADAPTWLFIIPAMTAGPLILGARTSLVTNTVSVAATCAGHHLSGARPVTTLTLAITLLSFVYIIQAVIHYLRRSDESLKDVRALNTELEEARDRANEASRAKSAFLANMSHELRTPLNAIIGYAELMRDEAAEAELDSFVADLEKVHMSADHLLSMINDVLDLSKIEAGKTEIRIRETDVEALVREVEATAMPLVHKKNNELVVEVGPNLEAIWTDKQKLKQSLLNLLSNAAKFTDKGHIWLTAKRDPSDAWLVCTVRDSGLGIPADRMNKLFDAFNQVKDSSIGEAGTGLGLTITERFCEMLGGRVEAKSELGKGSTFTLWLPVDARGVSEAE